MLAGSEKDKGSIDYYIQYYLLRPNVAPGPNVFGAPEHDKWAAETREGGRKWRKMAARALCVCEGERKEAQVSSQWRRRYY